MASLAFPQCPPGLEPWGRSCEAASSAHGDMLLWPRPASGQQLRLPSEPAQARAELPCHPLPSPPSSRPHSGLRPGVLCARIACCLPNTSRPDLSQSTCARTQRSVVFSSLQPTAAASHASMLPAMLPGQHTLRGRRGRKQQDFGCRRAKTRPRCEHAAGWPLGMLTRKLPHP